MSFHHKSDARDLPLDNVWITQIGSSLFSDICYFVHLSGIKKKKKRKEFSNFFIFLIVFILNNNYKTQETIQIKGQKRS